jgi:hypothetical protein
MVYQKGDSLKLKYSQYRNDSSMNNIKYLLDFNRLKNDTNLTESISIINNAEKKFNEFNRYNKNKAQEIEQLLKSLKVTSELSKIEIDEINSVFKSNLKKVQENKKLDSLILANNKNIINLLKNKCKYEIHDNLIHFEDNSCLFEYNFAIQNIRTSIQMNELNKKVDRLKNSEIYKRYNLN